MSDEVRIYNMGLVYASVCALKSLTLEEIAAEVNRRRPTGLSYPWEISKDETFKTGEPIPHQCTIDGDRQHWLLSC